MSNYKLLSVGNNAKTVKGDGSEYLTAISIYGSCRQSGWGQCVCYGRGGRVQGGLPVHCWSWQDEQCSSWSASQDYAMAGQSCCIFATAYGKTLPSLLKLLREAWHPALSFDLNGTSDIMWEKYLDMETEFPTSAIL